MSPTVVARPAVVPLLALTTQVAALLALCIHNVERAHTENLLVHTDSLGDPETHSFASFGYGVAAVVVGGAALIGMCLLGAARSRTAGRSALVVTAALQLPLGLGAVLAGVVALSGGTPAWWTLGAAVTVIAAAVVLLSGTVGRALTPSGPVLPDQ